MGNLSAVTAHGQVGLLDVRVTRIENDLWVYLTLSVNRSDKTLGTELRRELLVNHRFRLEMKSIGSSLPKTKVSQ